MLLLEKPPYALPGHIDLVAGVVQHREALGRVDNLGTPRFFRQHLAERDEGLLILVERVLVHSGGGEGMAHSRVAPFHGSAGAFRGLRAVRAMLTRNTRKDSPRMNEPTVSICFRVSKPSSAG